MFANNFPNSLITNYVTNPSVKNIFLCTYRARINNNTSYKFNLKIFYFGLDNICVEVCRLDKLNFSIKSNI